MLLLGNKKKIVKMLINIRELDTFNIKYIILNNSDRLPLKETDRQRDRQTYRQTQRETDRQTGGRQANRQREREKEKKKKKKKKKKKNMFLMPNKI